MAKIDHARYNRQLKASNDVREALDENAFEDVFVIIDDVAAAHKRRSKSSENKPVTMRQTTAKALKARRLYSPAPAASSLATQPGETSQSGKTKQSEQISHSIIAEGLRSLEPSKRFTGIVIREARSCASCPKKLRAGKKHFLVPTMRCSICTNCVVVLRRLLNANISTTKSARSCQPPAPNSATPKNLLADTASPGKTPEPKRSLDTLAAPHTWQPLLVCDGKVELPEDSRFFISRVADRLTAAMIEQNGNILLLMQGKATRRELLSAITIIKNAARQSELSIHNPSMEIEKKRKDGARHSGYGATSNTSASVTKANSIERKQQKGKTLFVGNLSFKVSEVELAKLFGQFGTVSHFTVPMHRATGRKRGFAFIEMSSPQDAQTAIKELNGKDIGNRKLSVKLTRPKVSSQKKPNVTSQGKRPSALSAFSSSGRMAGDATGIIRVRSRR